MSVHVCIIVLGSFSCFPFWVGDGRLLTSVSLKYSPPPPLKRDGASFVARGGPLHPMAGMQCAVPDGVRFSYGSYREMEQFD